jgi:glycosyltransferase involved in cell wall biosynthesis
MRIAIIADNISWRGVGVITKMQIKLLFERGIDLILIVPQNQFLEMHRDNMLKHLMKELIIVTIPNINVGFAQIIQSKKLNDYLDKLLSDSNLIYIPNMYYWASIYSKKKHIPSVITINMPWPVCFYQNFFFKHALCSGCIWSKNESSFNDYVKLYQCIIEKEGIIRSSIKFPLSLVKRDVIESYITMATKIIAISETVRYWLIKRFPDLSSKIRIVNLGALFPPLPYVPPDSNYNKLRLFYFSAPDEEKGIFNLLKALSIAVRLDRNITLKIMGASSGVKTMIYKLGLQDNVVLMPWYHSSEIFYILPEVIKDVDIVVVPSLIEEAWAGVATQAMALGRPVLVTNMGGLKEQVIDGFNGFYCECNDIISFAKKILELKNMNKDELYKMGLRAREHYLTKYDPYKIIDQLIKVFNEAILEFKY